MSLLETLARNPMCNAVKLEMADKVSTHIQHAQGALGRCDAQILAVHNTEKQQHDGEFIDFPLCTSITA
jgi:hypothetical protein